jgi:hypothetical protein
MEVVGNNLASAYVLHPFNLRSVAVAIADVFRKNRINVRNKFVRILKIFTKINDLKNRGVI